MKDNYGREVVYLTAQEERRLREATPTVDFLAGTTELRRRPSDIRRAILATDEVGQIFGDNLMPNTVYISAKEAAR